jgi:hypothetical protein
MEVLWHRWSVLLLGNLSTKQKKNQKNQTKAVICFFVGLEVVKV